MLKRRVKNKPQHPFIESLTTEQLYCHAKGHAWGWEVKRRWRDERQPGAKVRISEDCSRCQTVRYVLANGALQRLHVGYRYDYDEAKGYRYEGPEGSGEPPTRAEYLDALWERTRNDIQELTRV